MIQCYYAVETASIGHAQTEFYVIEKIRYLSCFFTVLWPFWGVLIFLDHPVFFKCFFACHINYFQRCVMLLKFTLMYLGKRGT